MSNFYLTVTIEKKWCSQNFDFPSLKNASPGQFLGSSWDKIVCGFDITFILRGITIF